MPAPGAYTLVQLESDETQRWWAFPVGGLACDRLAAATIRYVRGELLPAGLADDAGIDAPLAAIHSRLPR